jgi:hypothetical protein
MHWPYRRFKLAALFAFLTFYLYPLATYRHGEDATFRWLLLNLPSLLALLLPERALGFARGLAMGQSLVFGALTGLAVITGFPVWLVSRGNGPEIAEFATVLLGQIALFLAAVVLPNVRIGKYEKSTVSTWLTFPATIAFVIWAMVRLEDVGYNNMTPSGVYRVIACAESYAEHNNGQYPESLEQMVESAKAWFSPNCIYPFDARGYGKYGQLRYSPVKSPSGRVVGYSLLFGPRSFFGNLKAAEFIDQTGVIHVPKNHPIATASDPVRENVTATLAKWSQCLLKYRKEHPGAAFPRELRDMLKADWPCKPPVGLQEGNKISDNNYTIEYQSPSRANPNGASSFSLQARPNQYRYSGVRSYYVTEDGIIRATLKDRSANEGDAPIPACEWNVGMPCHPPVGLIVWLNFRREVQLRLVTNTQ